MIVENYDKNGNKLVPSSICLDLNYVYTIIKKYLNGNQPKES
jgi:hypothetical protein